MSIWTAFFLVVSVVVLASPLLSSPGGGEPGHGGEREGEIPPGWEEGELELDLATGRLAPEDYREITARRSPGRSL